MATLLNGQGLTKSFGASALFRGIGFVVNEGDRIGLIGPNGSGKSTLLGVLAGEIDPDEGQVARRRLTRLSYVAQVSEFPAKLPHRICESRFEAGVGHRSGDLCPLIDVLVGKRSQVREFIPTVFSHPKISSTRLRFRWLTS